MREVNILLPVYILGEVELCENEVGFFHKFVIDEEGVNAALIELRDGTVFGFPLREFKFKNPPPFTKERV